MIRKIAVEDVGCPGCANMIMDKLGQMEGVHNIEVNEHDHILTIEYEHHDHIWEDVKKSLVALGYREASTGNFKNNKN